MIKKQFAAMFSRKCEAVATRSDLPNIKEKEWLGTPKPTNKQEKK